MKKYRATMYVRLSSSDDLSKKKKVIVLQIKKY